MDSLTAERCSPLSGANESGRSLERCQEVDSGDVQGAARFIRVLQEDTVRELLRIDPNIREIHPEVGQAPASGRGELPNPAHGLFSKSPHNRQATEPSTHFQIEDVVHMGTLVSTMQSKLLEVQKEEAEAATRLKEEQEAAEQASAVRAAIEQQKEFQLMEEDSD